MNRPATISVPRRESGFTLIEIMIVIGIMAVVMAISVPSMFRAAEKESVRRMTQDVLKIFERARAKAIMNDQPVQLVIHPQERVFMVMPVEQAEGVSEEDYMSVELEKTLRQETESSDPEAKPRPREEDTIQLSDRMTIRFIGVNFVPDLQENEMVPVQFYPNGTSDEFSMVIESDSSEARLFQMEVPTALLTWEEP